MSISNLSGGSLAAFAALQPSPGGVGAAGLQANPLMQLFGGQGGGPLQVLQMLGPGSPLARMLQGSADDAMSMQQGMDDDDDSEDSDADLA